MMLSLLKPLATWAFTWLTLIPPGLAPQVARTNGTDSDEIDIEIQLTSGIEDEGQCPFQRALSQSRASGKQCSGQCPSLSERIEVEERVAQPVKTSGEEMADAIELVMTALEPVVLVFETEGGYCVIEPGVLKNTAQVTFIPDEAFDEQHAKTGCNASLAECPTPRKIKTSGPTNVDPELALLQRAYFELMRQGRAGLADDVREAITGGRLDPAVRPAAGVRDEIERHQVAYRAGQPGNASSGKPTARTWSSIARRTVSFHFRDATLSDVADYFHHATGLTVELRADATTRVQILCQDQPLEAALRATLGSCGLGYVVGPDRITIVSKSDVPRFAENHGVTSAWSP